MVLVATALIVLGGICALVGVSIFRMMLPIIGFIAGVMVGFGGVQAVFGAGVISSTIALVMAVVVGAIMALLSFVFFDVAIIILAMILTSSVFTYLGIAIGLQDAGFVLFLLGLAGAIMGLILATSSNLSVSFVVVVSAMLGAAYVLAGIMLLVGTLSLDDLSQGGIIPAVLDTVDQSFLWLFVWIGGSIIGIQSQNAVLQNELIDSQYVYKAK